MATEVRTVTSDDAVRLSLLTLSAGLESEWRAASERLLDSPPDSVERQRWDTAIAKLTDALATLEGYARDVDTTLGRRDWAARPAAAVRSIEPALTTGNGSE